MCLFDGHGLARQYQVRRERQAADPGQTLGSTGAWQNAEMNLRQADPGARLGNPVITGKRYLEPATQRRSVDRRHGNFGRRVQRIVDFGKHGCIRRGAGRELADVRSTAENPACRRDDDGLYRGIFKRFLVTFENPLPQCLTKCVDGWIVERDDGNVIVNFILDHGYPVVLVVW